MSSNSIIVEQLSKTYQVPEREGGIRRGSPQFLQTQI